MSVKSNAGGLPAHSRVGAGPDGSKPPLALGPPSQPGWLGTLDRFDLVRCIGEGGMGLVYLAHDPQRPEPVAIKLLRPDLHQSHRAMAYFLKEAQHVQRLKHPHILPVLEFKGDQERAYFVMPFKEEGNLSHALQSRSPLSETLLISIAQQMASALCFAHQRCIIHRDVKPTNILLDAQDQAFLADFGLARSLLNDALIDVRQSQWEGTASYLSPGTARGQQDDTRGDIYSFGAVLYEMLTGQPPYTGTTREEVIAQILSGPPTPISDLHPNASPVFVRIAERAMARELCDRYAHMSYVLEDLERAAKGEEPFGPDSQQAPAQPKAKKVRKHRRLVSVSLAMAAISLLALVAVPRRWLLAMAPTAKIGPPGLRLASKVELPGVLNWGSAKLDDYRGIGPPDLFVPSDKQLLVVSPAGQIINQWKIPDPSGDALRILSRIKLPASYFQPQASSRLPLTPSNSGESQPPELKAASDAQRTVSLVSWHSDAQVFLSVLNQLSVEVKRFSIQSGVQATPTSPVADSGILEAQVADLNGDGDLKVVLAVNSGRSLKPRGIYVFDYATQALLWHHDIGPCPVGLCVADINGDGKTEILCGSDAVDNGNRAHDGTDDHYSYIFALAHDGRLLWIRQLGGYYTACRPILANLDGHGRNDVLAWIMSQYEGRSREGDPELGFVVRLNAIGNVTARYDAGQVGLHSCLAADLGGHGLEDVLVTDRLGQLHVLNPDLSLRQKRQVVAPRYAEVWLRLWAIADVNGDHQSELVFTSTQREFLSGYNPGGRDGPLNVRYYHDNDVLVLDSKLKEIARFRLADRWETDNELHACVADLDGNGQPKVLALADKVYVLQWAAR
jgi:serine/threonine protein kinase